MSEKAGIPRVPELLVEKLAAGDLSDEEALAVRARLEAEDGGLARLDAIRRSNEEVLTAYPPARMARDVADRLRVQSAGERVRDRSPSWWVGLSASAAAAAALLLVVVLPAERPAEARSDDGETILTKGAEPRLRVFVQEPGGARALEPGDRARPGDVLQLAYVAAGERHGVILSLDGRGAVTLHLPSDAGAAASLDARGLVRLDSAFELDDAPGFERFFFVTAEAPFSSQLALEAARGLAAGGDPLRGPLRLPEGFGQVSFVVGKDVRAGER